MRSICVQLFAGFSSHPRFRYLLGAITVVGAYLLFLYRCVPPSTFEGFVDLPSFYATSIAVFRDHVSPYDVGRLTRINGLEFRTFPFLYPPPSVFLFQPLASLTLDQAKHVVTLINHLILAPTLVIIPLYALQLSPTRNYWRFLLCLLYPLLSYPLIVSVRYGQINIVLLAALIGFWIASQRKRHLLAGLWLSIAIICKTLPLLFIPMLLVIGRWKICAFTLIFLSLACLISYSILPREMWRDWLFNVVPSGAYMSEPYGLFFPSASWNQSLNGVVARASTRSLWSDPGFHSPLLGSILCYTGAAIAIAVTATLLYRARRAPHVIDCLVAVTLPTIFLVAPFSWEHHIVYLLPTILCILCQKDLSPSKWRLATLAAAAIAAVTFTFPGLLFYRFAGVLLLWLSALAFTGRCHSAPQESP